MKTTYRNMIVAAALAALGAGCSPDGGVDSANAASAGEHVASAGPGPDLLTVTAADFFFKAPASVPSGMTTIRLVNDGPELHHVQLVRIDEGHTLDELLDRVAAGELAPEWVTYVGGPNTPAPGERSEATLYLAPGQYAMLCLIPSPDGVPHLMKGMVLPITVTPGSGSDVPTSADVRMVLDNYSYGLSGEIRPGRRTVRVENAAVQPHEVLFVQLAPGKSAHDMVSWIEKPQGPPPGKPIGGTTLLGQGEVNFVKADFEPGVYALLCFVPDTGDGRPHVAHGMIREITVR